MRRIAITILFLFATLFLCQSLQSHPTGHPKPTTSFSMKTVNWSVPFLAANTFAAPAAVAPSSTSVTRNTEDVSTSTSSTPTTESTTSLPVVVSTTPTTLGYLEQIAITPLQQEEWQNVNRCEESGSWTVDGGTYSGGLGFSHANWTQFNTFGFPSDAAYATEDQQIRVAVAFAVYYYHDPDWAPDRNGCGGGY